MSRRSEAHDTHEGVPASATWVPGMKVKAETSSQADQLMLSKKACHRWLSLPRAKTSSRLGPHEQIPRPGFRPPAGAPIDLGAICPTENSACLVTSIESPDSGAGWAPHAESNNTAEAATRQGSRPVMGTSLVDVKQ